MELNRIVGIELLDNPLIFMCMVGGTVVKLLSVLFSTYLILWIQTFVEGTHGNPKLLANKEQGKTIYLNMMVVSVLISAFILPFVGTMVDRVSPKISIPFAFFFRAIVTAFFTMVNDPSSPEAFIVCIMLIVGSIIEVVSVDSIFNKNLPKETRGILSGAYSFCGQVGILLFSISAGWLFDNMGTKSPFYLTGLLDVTYALLIIIAIPCGLFTKYDEKEERSKLKRGEYEKMMKKNMNASGNRYNSQVFSQTDQR